ncbi:MAG TPA: helix-turn-helix domain-containing protein [Dehalococcoidia bacterium]|nr:helix-turn-helix domain-containing protein [Dehalococcoidia bacterium]
MTDEPLLTIPEVAQRLRLNPETVRRWLHDGRMRGYRIGSTRAGWRIPESEIRRVLTEGTTRPDGA